MKKLIEILFLLVPFMVYSQTVVETQYDAGVEYYMYITSSDSGDVTFTFPSSINAFDDDFTSNPIAYAIKIDTLVADGVATQEIIGVYIQGYRVDGWANIDTVLASDTLNASHSLASATFYGTGLIDMGETITKYSQLRVQVVNSAALGGKYAFYGRFYAYKRD